MPGRDDYRSNREYEEYERRRGEMDRSPQRRMGGAERRSFEPRVRYAEADDRYGRLGDYPGSMDEARAWRAERIGSRYDQDRSGYGRGWSAGWRRPNGLARDDREPWRAQRPDEPGYGGQEYGIEAHGDEFARSSSVVQEATDGGRRLRGRFGEDERGDPPFRGEAGQMAWRDDGGPYGDSRLDRQDRAMQEFGVPHDYGFHPHDDEFEPHYTHWRDEQMRRHDEAYRNWRARQLRQYDEDYRAWRGERRQAFGETFSEWRRNRTADGQDRIEPPPWQTEADPASASPDMNAETETRYELGGPSEAKGDSEAKGGAGFAQASPAVQKATDGAAKDDREAKDRG